MPYGFGYNATELIFSHDIENGPPNGPIEHWNVMYFEVTHEPGDTVTVDDFDITAYESVGGFVNFVPGDFEVVLEGSVDSTTTAFQIRLTQQGADKLIDFFEDNEQDINIVFNVNYNAPDGNTYSTTYNNPIQDTTDDPNAEITDNFDGTFSDDDTPDSAAPISIDEDVLTPGYNMGSWSVTDNEALEINNFTYSLVDLGGGITLNAGSDYTISLAGGLFQIWLQQPGIDKIQNAATTGNPLNLQANITYTDDQGNVTSEMTAFTINPVNDAPTISNLYDDNVDEDNPVGTAAHFMKVYFNDDENINSNDINMSITTAGALSGITLNQGTDFTITEIFNSGVQIVYDIDLTPQGQQEIESFITTGDVGEVILTATVTDADGNTTTETFTKIINGLNDPATIDNLYASNVDEDDLDGGLYHFMKVYFKDDDDMTSSNIGMTISTGGDLTGITLVQGTHFTITEIFNSGVQIVYDIDLTQEGMDLIGDNLSTGDVGEVILTASVTDSGGEATTETFVKYINGLGADPNAEIVDNIDGTDNDDMTAPQGPIQTINEGSLASGYNLGNFNATDNEPLDYTNFAITITDPSGNLTFSTGDYITAFSGNDPYNVHVYVNLLTSGVDKIQNYVTSGQDLELVIDITCTDSEGNVTTEQTEYLIEADPSTMPGVNNLDLVYGFVGDDDNGPGGDPDNNEDPEMIMDDLDSGQPVLLATFDTTDDPTGWGSQLGYQNVNTGGQVNISTDIVSMGGNTYGIYLSASAAQSVLDNIVAGQSDMELQIWPTGQAIEEYDFHYVDNTGGGNNPPHIDDGTQDQDGQDNDVTVRTVSENDIGTFTSLHNITDENPATVQLAMSSGYEPVLVDLATGNSYDLGSGYFNVSVSNGTLVFNFTTTGISQLGIDQMDSGDTMSFAVTYHVEDDQGNISDTHTLTTTVLGQGGGNPPGNNPPHIEDADQDSDGSSTNDQSLIELDESDVQPGAILFTCDITDETPGTVYLDTSASFVTYLNTGESVDLPSSYFNVQVNNGTLEFALTSAGIDHFGIEDLNDNQSGAFSAVLRVKDAQGLESDYHVSNIIIAGETNGGGGGNDDPHILDAPIDSDGDSTNEFTTIDIDESDVLNLNVVHTITDEMPDTVELVDSGMFAPIIVNTATGESWSYNSMQADYFTVEVDNGQLTFSITSAGMDEFGINDLNDNEVMNLVAVYHVIDEDGNMSVAHNTSLTIHGEDNGGGNPPGQYGLYDAFYGHRGVDQYTEIVQDGEEYALYTNDLPASGNHVLAVIKVPAGSDLVAKKIQITNVTDPNNPIQYGAQPKQGVHFDIIVDPNNPEMHKIELLPQGIQLLNLLAAGNVLEFTGVIGSNNTNLQPIEYSFEYVAGNSGGSDNPPIIQDENDDLGNPGDDQSQLVVDETDIGNFIAEFNVDDEMPGTVDIVPSAFVLVDPTTGDSYSISDGIFDINYSNGTLTFNLTNNGITELGIDQMGAGDTKNLIITMQVVDENNNTSQVHTLFLKVNGEDDDNTPPTIVFTDVEDFSYELDTEPFIEFTLNDADGDAVTITDLKLTYFEDTLFGGSTEIEVPANMYSYTLNPDGTGYIEFTQAAIDIIQNYVGTSGELNFQIDMTIDDGNGGVTTVTDVDAKIIGGVPNEDPDITVVDNEYEESELPIMFEFSVSDDAPLSELEVTNVVITTPGLFGQDIPLDPADYTVSLVNGVGQITLSAAKSQELMDELDDGETETFKVTLTVEDDDGGSDTITDIPVTIHGESEDSDAPTIAADSSVDIDFSTINNTDPFVQFTVTDASAFNVYVNDTTGILGGTGGPTGPTPPVAPFFNVTNVGSVFTVTLTQLGVDTIAQYMQDNDIDTWDTYPLEIMAVDEHGNSVTQTMNANVVNDLPVNTPPSIQLVEDQSIMEAVTEQELEDMVDGDGQITLATFEVDDAESDPEDLDVVISGLASSDDQDIILTKGVHYVLEGAGALKTLKLTTAGVDELLEEVGDLTEDNAVDFTVTVSDGVLTPPPFEFTLELDADDGPSTPPNPPTDDGSVTADSETIEVTEDPYVTEYTVDLDDFSNDTNDPNEELTHHIDEVSFIHEDGTVETIDINDSDMFSFDEIEGEFVIDVSDFDVQAGEQVKVIIGHSAEDVHGNHSDVTDPDAEITFIINDEDWGM